MTPISEAVAAATACHQAGRLNDAECLYRQILAITPEDATVLCNLGVVLAAQDRHGEAVPYFERAHALRPDCGETLKALSLVCRHAGLRLFLAGDFSAAAPLLERTLGIEGDQPSLLNVLGSALQKLRRLSEAVDRYRRALCLKPDFAEALLNLGTALQEQGQLTQAVRRYRQAARVDPRLVGAYSNMGCALRDLGRFGEVLAGFDQALALQPDAVDILQSRLFSLIYLDHLSAPTVAAEHVRAGAVLMAGRAAPACRPPRERRERLRIGYVSPDFRRHPVSSFLEPLLSAHDRTRFEIVCYAEIPNPDAVTARLRAYADQWWSTVGLTDAVLADTIRGHGIDILVDLAGHTRGNRLPAFAFRPAPVQATWLGYPHSTGFPAMDYRLVDAVTDPPGEAEILATETLIRLEGGFVCFKPPEGAPPPEEPPCLRTGVVTLGSFNNPSKLSPSTVETWAAILHRLPAARLLLKGLQLADESAREVLLSRFASHGIAADRLDIMGFLPDSAGHLGLYGRVDIALDPFPYNGTTTTCEALWMGVPVVTLLGDRHAGRVGASLLGRVGLDGLIARDRNDYRDRVVALVGDSERLAALRAGLRQRMAASSLCDAAAFARRIEGAYRVMWSRCEAASAGL